MLVNEWVKIFQQVFTPNEHGLPNRLVPVEDEFNGSVYPVLDREPYVLVEDEYPFEQLVDEREP